MNPIDTPIPRGILPVIRRFETKMSRREFRHALEALDNLNPQMMSPTALIPNPAGADQFTPVVGAVSIAAVNGDSAAFAPGLFVLSVTPYAPNLNPPGGTEANTPFSVKRPSTSPAYSLIIGVAAGVLPAGQSTYPIGGILEVVTEGPALITCDDGESGTTIGDYITASTTTAGQGTDSGSSTPTVGEGLAVALQTVSIVTGSASVWCYVHKL